MAVKGCHGGTTAKSTVSHGKIRRRLVADRSCKLHLSAIPYAVRGSLLVEDCFLGSEECGRRRRVRRTGSSTVSKLDFPVRKLDSARSLRCSPETEGETIPQFRFASTALHRGLRWPEPRRNSPSVRTKSAAYPGRWDAGRETREPQVGMPLALPERRRNPAVA
jgi:hypothetical protein